MEVKHLRLHRDIVKRAPEPALTTVNGQVMSVVYVTARPTFTGVIGGYATMSYGDDSDPDTDESSQPTYTQSRNSVQTPSSAATRHASGPVSSLAGNPTAVATDDAGALYPSSAGGYGSYSNTAIAGSSSTDTASQSSTTGPPMGAIIGIAVGAFAGIGIIAALILFLLARKRQKMKKEQAENEKKNMPSPPVVAQPTETAPPNAPRLSLRPISSLAPGFMGNKQDHNSQQGNMLTPIGDAASARARGQSSIRPAGQAQNFNGDRPRTGDNPFRDPENPFADPEKAMGTAGSRSPVSPLSGSSTPAPGSVAAVSANGSPKDQRISGPTVESFPIPQTQTYGQPPPGAVPAQTPRSGPHANSNVTYAELPGAPAPVIAQGPGPEGPQSNVYRILMDFRPTMEDELELRAGQLVRMLHEYDDGWALCIRLDRSQQGVVPRTCLAAKPSKPRPGPPPMGPNSRPITPQGRSRGPPTGPPGPPGPGFGSPRAQGPAPAPVRAQSPVTVTSNTGAFNQPPRPLSPGPRPQPQAQKRSQSPGPYATGGPKPMAPTEQRQRSNSASALSVRTKLTTPPGPSKLGPGLPPVGPDSPGLAM